MSDGSLLTGPLKLALALSICRGLFLVVVACSDASVALVCASEVLQFQHVH